MKANPLLEEIWRVKDQLAAEAGYDLDRYIAQLRTWTAAHPPVGPVVRDPAELQRLTGSLYAPRDSDVLAVGEAPPPPEVVAPAGAALRWPASEAYPPA